MGAASEKAWLTLWEGVELAAKALGSDGAAARHIKCLAEGGRLRATGIDHEGRKVAVEADDWSRGPIDWRQSYIGPRRAPHDGVMNRPNLNPRAGGDGRMSAAFFEVRISAADLRGSFVTTGEVARDASTLQDGSSKGENEDSRNNLPRAAGFIQEAIEELWPTGMPPSPFLTNDVRNDEINKWLASNKRHPRGYKTEYIDKLIIRMRRVSAIN